MRLISLLLFIIAFAPPCFSQANLIGNTNFHAYMGTDWYKTLYKVQFDDTTSESGINEDGENIIIDKIFKVEKNTSTGCIGLRVEHFITKKFTVGLDFWFAHTQVVARCYRKDYLVSDSVFKTITTPYATSSAILSKDLTRLNSTLRFDLHFGRSKWIDPYVHVAIGAAIYKFITTSSNTAIHEENPIYIPFSFKLGGGAKFWLRKDFAAFIELSAGGPIFAGGICYKMPQKIKLDLKEDPY